MLNWNKHSRWWRIINTAHVILLNMDIFFQTQVSVLSSLAPIETLDVWLSCSRLQIWLNNNKNGGNISTACQNKETDRVNTQNNGRSLTHNWQSKETQREKLSPHTSDRTTVPMSLSCCQLLQSGFTNLWTHDDTRAARIQRRCGRRAAGLWLKCCWFEPPQGSGTWNPVTPRVPV